MNKRPRIYYIPGIISLLFLPLASIIYLELNNREERLIEIAMPQKYIPLRNRTSTIFYDTTVLSQPKNIRKYTLIELNDDSKSNKEKIANFKEKIDYLVSTKDTLNGLKIQFGKKSTYNDLIEVLNICYFADTVTHFILYEDNLWFLHKNISHEDKIRSRKWDEGRINEQRKREIELFNERTIELSKEPIFERLKSILKIWPSLIVFVILGVISVRKMIKK